MSKMQRGQGSKYADAFKRQLVAESRASGVTVLMVAKRHGVPTSRLYSWRSDARFQSTEIKACGFTPVEVTGAPNQPNDIAHLLPEPRIEIILENGRKLVVTSGVDAGFVLELARGLAA